jgi:CheY-like chemotaxis protein
VPDRLRVVAADNDVDALDLVVTDLRLEGHDVVAVAVDSEGAVAACLREHPDVLVIDYRMPPGSNGIEAARQVRAVLPDLRIVLYTNYRRAALAREADALGVTFLAKGDLRALRRAVGRAGSGS